MRLVEYRMGLHSAKSHSNRVNVTGDVNVPGFAKYGETTRDMTGKKMDNAKQQLIQVSIFTDESFIINFILRDNIMRVSISIFLFLISSVCFGNKIDELKTPEDVLKFIHKTFDKQDRFHIKSNNLKGIDFKFIKLDINKDGLTDILINGIYLYAIIDIGGRNNFEENYIGGNHFGCELLSIDTSKTLPIFIVQKDNDYDNATDKEMVFKPDTLVNLYGGFIEYNSSPNQIDFKKIKIATTPCFGTCPVFELTIDTSRQAILDAKEYNKLKGVYKSIIDEKVFSTLIGLLSYLNIDSLKNNYAIGWTDNPSVDTEIEYNGSKKKIHDYGLEGSFGLKRLYGLLYKLKTTQDWE